jgi:class 3 adenylate cyclase
MITLAAVRGATHLRWAMFGAPTSRQSIDSSPQGVIDCPRGFGGKPVPFDAAPAPPALGLRGLRSPCFVGRSRERGWLARCLEESLAGRPRIVLVSGEAGLGKTRLAREIEVLARAAHVHVCRGRAYEDLALPYTPFLEILRDQLDEMPEAVTRALGHDAERLLALVRGEPLPTSASRLSPGGSGAEMRAGLFVSLCGATLALARLRPTLLVLDDLHWADEATLDQLAHLVFALADTEAAVSLMVIGLHRVPDPGGPLERALARLGREPVVATLELGGLDESEVTELVAELGVQPPSRQLATAIHQTTGGNPLFVEEVVHALQRNGWIEERGGFQVTRTPVDELALPASPTAAIAMRTAALGERCRAALTFAAFFGDRWSVPAVAAASGIPEPQILEAVDEGRRHGLVRGDDELIEFAHPLVRHVLYTEPGTLERQRVHRSIAASLELRHAARARDHALEIAHHLVRAGGESEPAKVAAFARLAGDQAFARLAWADAARFYEAAASASREIGRSSPTELAELHFLAGMSHYRNMDTGPCTDHLDRAIDGYRACGDARGLARALVERTRVRFTMGVHYGAQVERGPFDEALAALPDGEAALRGWLHVMVAESHFNAREHEAAETEARRALELGHAAGDATLCAHSASSLGVALMQQLRLEEALETLQAALADAGLADPWSEGWLLQRLPIVLTWRGDLELAEQTTRRACELSRSTQDWAEYSLALATHVAGAVARGEFQRAEEQARESLAMARRSHYPWGAALSLGALAGARALRGDFAGAGRAVDMLVAPGEVFEDAGPALGFLARVYRQLIAARQGKTSEEPLAVRLLVADPSVPPDPQTLSALCAGAETALRLGDVAVAASCSAPLARAASSGVALSTGWIFLVPRILGAIAARQEDWERAERCFAEAESLASRSGARAELALTLLDRARALARRSGSDDRRRAGELLQRASALFDDLGMAPLEEEAIELAAELGLRLPKATRAGARAVQQTFVRDAGPLAPEHSTLMVTDVVGSTALIERLGEDRAHDLIQKHNAILRACLQAYRGREIQHTGDGVIAAFRSASSAVHCAIAIQEDFAQQNARSPDVPIRVRIGLHAGEVRPEEGRVFGAAVNAAVRICALADACRILVSDAVRQPLGEGRIRLRERGPAHLKGFVQPFQLHEVEWGEETRTESAPGGKSCP